MKKGEGTMEQYKELEMEVIAFDMEDVITTSTTENDPWTPDVPT